MTFLFLAQSNNVSYAFPSDLPIADPRVLSSYSKAYTKVRASGLSCLSNSYLALKQYFISEAVNTLV